MMDSHLSRPSSPPSPDPAALASEFLDRGIEAFDQNERAMAWGWLHKALSVSKSTKDPKGLAAAGWRLSLLKAQQGEVDEAIALCRTAHQAAESVWSRQDMAQSAHLLGNLLCQSGDQEDGMRMLHSAVDLFGELNDVEGQLRAWRTIGGILRKRGSYYEAIEAWKRCLVVYNQRGDLNDQARLHSAIARSWMRIGDNGQTITHALASLGRHRHLESDRIDGDLKLLTKLRRRMGGDAFTAGVSQHLDPEGVGMVIGMVAQYDARKARQRAARALAEATSDLSEAEQGLISAAPASVAVPDTAARPTPPSVTDPVAEIASELKARDGLYGDTLDTWEDTFWDSRRARLPQQPWQIWVLAGFGTVIGVMTVMVILSVGTLIFR
jgi:tetratricopeptide (TPR) repeat protein